MVQKGCFLGFVLMVIYAKKKLMSVGANDGFGGSLYCFPNKRTNMHYGEAK